MAAISIARTSKITYFNKDIKGDVGIVPNDGRVHTHSFVFHNEEKAFAMEFRITIPKELKGIVTIPKEQQDIIVRQAGRKEVKVSVDTSKLNGLTMVELPFRTSPYGLKFRLVISCPSRPSAPPPPPKYSPPSKTASTSHGKQ